MVRTVEVWPAGVIIHCVPEHTVLLHIGSGVAVRPLTVEYEGAAGTAGRTERVRVRLVADPESTVALMRIATVEAARAPRSAGFEPYAVVAAPPMKSGGPGVARGGEAAAVWSLVEAIEPLRAAGFVFPGLDPVEYMLTDDDRWGLRFPEAAREPASKQLRVGPHCPPVCDMTMWPDGVSCAQYLAAHPDAWWPLTVYAHLASVAMLVGPPSGVVTTKDIREAALWLPDGPDHRYNELLREFDGAWAVHQRSLVNLYCGGGTA